VEEQIDAYRQASKNRKELLARIIAFLCEFTLSLVLIDQASFLFTIFSGVTFGFEIFNAGRGTS
jgi:hypothetical protein